MTVAHQLRTSRLLLRRWKDADREPFAALNADPRVMEHFPTTQSREESDAAVARIQAHFDEHEFRLVAFEPVPKEAPLPDGVELVRCNMAADAVAAASTLVVSDVDVAATLVALVPIHRPPDPQAQVVHADTRCGGIDG